MYLIKLFFFLRYVAFEFIKFQSTSIYPKFSYLTLLQFPLISLHGIPKLWPAFSTTSNPTLSRSFRCSANSTGICLSYSHVRFWKRRTSQHIRWLVSNRRYVCMSIGGIYPLEDLKNRTFIAVSGHFSWLKHDINLVCQIYP